VVVVANILIAAQHPSYLDLSQILWVERIVSSEDPGSMLAGDQK
jgi:hypothetical protein